MVHRVGFHYTDFFSLLYNCVSVGYDKLMGVVMGRVSDVAAPGAGSKMRENKYFNERNLLFPHTNLNQPRPMQEN
jgi:hypothetical protein